MTRTPIKELSETLDMEAWLDRESISYKLGHGSSGLQLNLKECPCCGDRRWRVYLNAETGLGNCLAGETEILTREFGAVPIARVAGRTVTLLDGNGDWVPCVIVDHGEQTTYAIPFADGVRSYMVRSTAEHGWINTDGEVVLTKDFERNPQQHWIADLRPARVVRDRAEYERGVIHGLIYGDGNKESFGTYRIRVCSHHESITPWLSRFPYSVTGEARWTNGPNGDEKRRDPRFYISRKEAWCELKEFPEKPSRSLDYLLGFMRGWFAADGCVSTQAEAMLCCGPEELEWIKIWAPLIGWQVRGHSDLVSSTNYGNRNKRSLNVRFKRTSLSVDDLLIAQHQERWNARALVAKPIERVWRSRFKPTDPRVERVYCPIVPTTHSFALANGIHSRNCFVCNEGFSKLGFVRAHLGDDMPWHQVFDHVKEALKEQGWRPKRTTTAAVETGTVMLPLSFELPTAAGENLVYLENRGVDNELCAYFHLRFCEEGWWNFVTEDGKRSGQRFDNRIIIPVFDLDGTLKTFQGRDITGESDRKYLFPKALPGTGRYLFNGQNAGAAKHVVMGEGVFDVIALKKALDEDPLLRGVVPVGSFGKHLSYGSLDGDDQLGRFRQLKSRGLERVTIMWDGEPKALESALDAARLLTGIGLKTFIALLPLDKDPNEVLPEVVREAFSQAKPYSKMLEVKWRLDNPYRGAR